MIGTLVDKHITVENVNKMREYLTIANNVNENSLFEAITQARLMLSKAEGMYEVLKSDNRLPDWKMYLENICRIKEKHDYILLQKRRQRKPIWKK